MKKKALCCIVILVAVLGLNVSAMADFVITDTFSSRSGTDLGTTEDPGLIYSWAETKSDSGQDVFIDETWGVMGCSGWVTACANIDGLNLDLFTQTVDISVDFSMVGTGEALVEYMKSSNAHPFGAAAYFVAIHPTGVISLKRNDAGNIVDLARVENLTLSKAWDSRDALDIHVEMTAPGVVQSVVSHNGTEIINVVDSSINARAFGTVALSNYGGWVTNVIYDNLEISVAEIPEPATLSLLCVGGLLTLFRKRAK